MSIWDADAVKKDSRVVVFRGDTTYTCHVIEPETAVDTTTHSIDIGPNRRYARQADASRAFDHDFCH